MKYYSEILDKTFNTEKECVDAEKAYKQKNPGVVKKPLKDDGISKQKKELAKAIEDAEKEVEEADRLYDIAQDEAAKILDDANKKAEEILESAQKQVREAQKKKLNAVQAFNTKFGVYTTTITGAKALEEFKKSLQRFDSLWKELWF